MGQNKWRYSKKSISGTDVDFFLRGKKIIVNQSLLCKLWYIGQICSNSKPKKEDTILSGTGKKYCLPDT